MESQEKSIDSIPGWDEYFLNMLSAIKARSKDTSVKFGCVIVGPQHDIRTTGYNSFPRKIRDNVAARYERPEKYLWFEHAERNAIYNAARTGTPLEGCTLYVNGVPCMDCARGAVQVGIERLVYDGKYWDEYIESLKARGVANTWVDHIHKVSELFNEAGVTFEKFYSV